MHSFRVGGSSLPTFERSVNKRRCCLSRLDRVPPRSVSVLYSIATGSLVSLFRRFPRLRAEGRKRGGRKSGGEGDRRLCPRFHVMQKVGPVCFDVSFPAAAVKSRITAAVRHRGCPPTCSRFMRISAGVHFDPRSTCLLLFFLCARRFLSSPQLSRIGYKRRHLILNKGNDFICFSHLLQRSFFLFLRRKIYRVINHVDIHISCSFVHFFNFYVYRSSMHFFSICHLYVMYRSDSQQF